VALRLSQILLALLVGVLAGCGGGSATTGPTGSSGQLGQQDAASVVPNLVGKTGFAARKALGHGGPQLAYSFLGHDLSGEPCAGLPNHGEVVRQDPKPGTQVGRHASVQVQFGCPSLADLPPCPANELHLDATVQPIGAGSPNGIDAFVKHVYGGPCRLQGEIRVSLVHPGDALATEIEGNPSTVPIDQPLGVGETGDITWGWSGCPHGKFAAVFSGPDGLSVKRKADTYCQERGVPNRVYPSHGEFSTQPFSGLNSDGAYKTALRALKP
jgi:PASTA domain